MKSDVTIVISTKDRYFTTLPLCLISIANQTVLPEHIFIYDDGKQLDLRKELIYQDIFLMLQQKGINWEVKFGERKGQVLNHQKSISDVKTTFIYRLDDDNILSPSTLEILLKNMSPDVGAVGGLVLDPKIELYSSSLASNKIEDIYLGLNVQWFRNTLRQEVDHLYSTFLFRKEAAMHGYCNELSRVGHREETIFTFEMKKAGWKLLVIPEAITWHFRNEVGGIRSDSNISMWQHDEEVFKKKLDEWGIIPRVLNLIVLDNGLGDHLIFSKLLPEIKEKYKDLVLATCYPQVFEDDTEIKQISIAEAKMVCDIEKYNLYKWMDVNHWNKPVEEAYRCMYL